MIHVNQTIKVANGAAAVLSFNHMTNILFGLQSDFVSFYLIYFIDFL